MHLVSCLHPQRIYNQYLDKYLYVPCRKCDACRNIYRLQWQQRIIQESRQHKYVYFFTLTYDENNVPLLRYGEDGHTLYNSDSSVSIDTEKLLLSEVDRLYLDSREEYPIVSRKDVQDFVKRFRSHVHYLLKKTNKISIENEKIRYFICSEYGPSTYRSHYHGLFFIDSETVSANIESLLHKSWTKGYISFSAANDKRYRYVAKYVSGVSCLPKIYENRSISPFFLSSKKPAIASGCYGIEDYAEMFHKAESTQVIYDNGKYVDVPLWRCLENKIFPKCCGFSELTHIERVALYGISEGNVISRKGKEVKIRNYAPLETPIYPLDSNEEYSRDLELFRMSRRVLSLCRSFGVSLDDYVTQIEKYYVDKDYRLLKQQLQFEESYTFSHPSDLHHLLHIDGVFLDNLLSNSSRLNGRELTIVESYGLDRHDFFSTKRFDKLREKLSYDKSFDYINMFSLHDKMVKDSLRSKHHNDYIDYQKYKSVNYNHIY